MLRAFAVRLAVDVRPAVSKENSAAQKQTVSRFLSMQLLLVFSALKAEHTCHLSACLNSLAHLSFTPRLSPVTRSAPGKRVDITPKRKR